MKNNEPILLIIMGIIIGTTISAALHGPFSLFHRVAYSEIRDRCNVSLDVSEYEMILNTYENYADYNISESIDTLYNYINGSTNDKEILNAMDDVNNYFTNEYYQPEKMIKIFSDVKEIKERSER